MKVPRTCLVVVICLLAVVWSAAAIGAPARPPGRSAFGHFSAGASRVDISPPSDEPWSPYVMLAGYDRDRSEWLPPDYPYSSLPMQGVADPLWARAVVMSDGETTLTVVAIDSIGLGRPDVEEIREAVAPYVGDNVYIVSSHSHSTPDVIGLWGLIPSEIPGWYFWEGDDPAPYITFLKARVIDSILAAYSDMERAFISYGVSSTDPADLVAYNADEGDFFDTHTPGPPWEPERGRGPHDEDIVVAHITARTHGHPTIATLFNYAVHPEVAGGSDDPSVALLASSDVARGVRDVVEDEVGGVAVWLQGALGAMVTTEQEEDSWDEADRIGEALGARVLEAVFAAEREPNPIISTAERDFVVPLYNSQFFLGMYAGLLHDRAGTLTYHPDGPALYYDGEVVASEIGVVTSAAVLQIGGLQIACTPGETYPKIGLHIKGLWPQPYDVLPPYWSEQPEGPDPALLTAPYQMVLGLVNDEIGYIMYPEDYYDPTRPELPNAWSQYRYESGMSVGPTVGDDIEAALAECLDELGAATPRRR